MELLKFSDTSIQYLCFLKIHFTRDAMIMMKKRRYSYEKYEASNTSKKLIRASPPPEKYVLLRWERTHHTQ